MFFSISWGLLFAEGAGAGWAEADTGPRTSHPLIAATTILRTSAILRSTICLSLPSIPFISSKPHAKCQDDLRERWGSGTGAVSVLPPSVDRGGQRRRELRD